MTPTPEALVSARDAAHLLTVLPVLREELGGMERALENRVLSQYRDSTLTPEVSHAAWVEKNIYRNIISRIEQKIRAAGMEV